MMSIAEQFGRRPPRQDPIMPPVPRPSVAPAADKAAQALAFMTSMNEQNEQLREENARLRADLNLSMLRCRDLELERNSMRGLIEQYRRYAVSWRNRIQTMMDSMQRAHDEALDIGDIEKTAPDQQAERQIA